MNVERLAKIVFTLVAATSITGCVGAAFFPPVPPKKLRIRYRHRGETRTLVLS